MLKGWAGVALEGDLQTPLRAAGDAVDTEPKDIPRCHPSPVPPRAGGALQPVGLVPAPPCPSE